MSLWFVSKYIVLVVERLNCWFGLETNKSASTLKHYFKHSVHLAIFFQQGGSELNGQGMMNLCFRRVI